MIVWLDNHLSPQVARWLARRLNCECKVVRDLGFSRASDVVIFQAARAANAILITKDADFASLIDRIGPPPQVTWLTCGNTSTIELCAFLEARLDTALSLLTGGEAIVEIG